MILIIRVFIFEIILIIAGILLAAIILKNNGRK